MEPTRDVVEQAALWHARLGDDENRTEERRAFEVWRSKDPLHALAFDRIAALDNRISPQGQAERIALKKLAARRIRSLPSLGALCVAIFVAWQATQLPQVAIWLADYRTAPGVLETATLPDGSTMTIGTNTAVNADVDAHARTLELLRGEILIDVQKNPNASFVVRTDHGTARALGTAYAVRRNADDTMVTVLHSNVEVCTLRSHCETLTPGQRARLDASGLQRLTDVNIDDASAWTRGWLTVNDVPLADVLGELNRYRPSPIQYDANALSGMHVSGHYPLRDTDRTLQAIARALPISIDKRDPARPRVSPR